MPSVSWKALLSSVTVFVLLGAPGILGKSDFGQSNLQKNVSRYSIPVNIQAETNRSHVDGLTIFELVATSKLQTYAEDVMGVRKFQEPFWVSTSYLTNLLDSSQWNLKKAKIKFRKAMERRARNVNLVNQIPEENLFEYFNFETKGYDKEGCPVIIIPLGEWRTYRSYIEKVKSISVANKNLKVYFGHIMNDILQQVQRNLLCSHITFIADMEGYLIHHNSGIKFFADAIKHFERSYPGLLKIAFVINSSPEFLKTAQSFKSAIPWDLRRKSFVFTEKHFWQGELLKQIDPSHIAPKYGGENIFLESR